MDVEQQGEEQEELSREQIEEQSGFSRRTLVKGALVGGAALMLPQGAFAAPAATRATEARFGGRLRVGMVGGGASETLDPNQQVNEIDTARSHILFERLTDFRPDGSIYNQLAEEFSANKSATVWKIKLRDGVHFHDGSRFGADDVVYSLRYMLDPKTKSQGGSELRFLKPQNVRKLDRLTVELRLDGPNALIPGVLSSRAIYMFKRGTTSFDKPNGTGPFKFTSWTRGERSLFSKHKDYRIARRPYLNELEIISINDPTARLNALGSGQVDAIQNLSSGLVPAVIGNSKLRILNSRSGVYTCQTMFCDTPPFNDVRVRQALRLAVDRPQLVANALGGYGTVGNDLACYIDPDYAKGLPQRQHDPEKAKSLLAQAGQSNLTLTLATSDVASGMLSSSTLIAQQAKAAGITINLDNAPTDQYWGTRYLKSPFACTSWGYRPLDSQIAQALNKSAPYNETHWFNEQFDGITNQARRTLDSKKRHALWVEAQTMLHDDGGYIIWGFLNTLDAYSAKVHGLVPSVARPLGWYTFTNVYLA